MKDDKKKDLPMDREELRRLAEERVSVKMAGSFPQSEEATQRLVHELEMHQIELELQNEELRQARDEMETALERYTDLYDFAPVGYCTLDNEGGISEVNLTGATLLGVDRSRLIGRSFELFVSPESRQAFSMFLGQMFDNRQKIRMEVALTTKDGRSRWVLIEGLSCEFGRACRFAIIDMTERKRAQDELAEKRRQCEELNKDLEARILQAVDELRQKDQMMMLQDRQALMGEMINNIAHQWRQPLNTLGLLVQQMPIAFDTGGLTRAFLEENAAMAMKMIQQMSRTIDDFRGFFKSDKKMVAFEVNQVISHTLSFIDKTLKDNNIDVAVLPEGDPVVNGYPNEYAQVLINILMNARDALVERNVENTLISIHTFVEGGRSVVTVSDNAGGVADGIIDKVFEPYFTTKGSEQGTGIGLYMSRLIIEQSMGGRLTVRNTGNGAEFRIEV